MVKGGDSRTGAPVVSVADLIARDAPWSGSPEAVDVTGGRAAVIPAQRASSRPDGARPGRTRPDARAAARSVAARSVAARSVAARSVARPRRPAIDLLRRFVVAAWGPNWRFITVCACVLVAGLLGNVVLLATLSTPDHGAQAAGSAEGGYPADAVDEPPRLTVEPPPATLPGVGLPLALASLGQTVSAGDRATAPRSASALVGAPVGGGGSVITGSGSGTTTSTSGSGAGTRANSGTLGGTVAGVGEVAGGAVDGVGDVLGGPLAPTVKGLGKTTKQLTDTVGGTLDGVTEGLLGGSRNSRDSRDSDSRDGRDSRDARDDDESGSRSGDSGSGAGGVLGGLLGGGR